MYSARTFRVKAWLLLVLAGAGLACGSATANEEFPQGVAAGDVRPGGAWLWTRTTGETELTLEIATDPGFRNVVITQAVTALAANDFTAETRVFGLTPNSRYYYRWGNGTVLSRTGQFKTAPTRFNPASVRFAFSGDSDGTRVDGVPGFNNFESLAAARGENLDFFLYVGDLIYSDSSLRDGGPATTLEEYRDAYRVNREIAALPDLLADAATYVMWDDHEVLNDYDGQTVDPERYANGREAFFEWFPLSEAQPLPADPTCAGRPLFRRFRHGSDVELIFLDERSCRSASVEEACALAPGEFDLAPTLPPVLRIAFGLPPLPPEGCLDAINDPARTLLGPAQKTRLKAALLTSSARFKFIVGSLAIQQFYALPYDRWEGYAAERREILDFIRANNVDNVVFLSTDLHTNFINEVFVDLFTDPEPIAEEFVTGPIATFTFREEIEAIDPELVDLLFLGLDLVGMDCANIDAYSYGVVDVDPLAGTLRVSLKDDQGAVLADDRDAAVSCTKTLNAN